MAISIHGHQEEFWTNQKLANEILFSLSTKAHIILIWDLREYLIYDIIIVAEVFIGETILNEFLEIRWTQIK